MLRSIWRDPSIGRWVVLAVGILLVSTELLGFIVPLLDGDLQVPPAIRLAFACVLGWNMFRGRPWARWVTLALLGLSLLLAIERIGSLSMQDPTAGAQIVIGIILLQAVLALLIGPGVGAHFGQEWEEIRAADTEIAEIAKQRPELPDDAGPALVFRAVSDLDAALEQGDLEDYYSGPHADTAYFAEQALRAIGARETGPIIIQANRLFDGGAPPRDTGERRRALQTMSRGTRGKLWQLDEQLGRNGDNLTKLLQRYVHDHEDAFPESRRGTAS